ncbi:hypothetical protein GHT89_16650 [Acinetobacter baumannii]|uniref:TrbI/VirB10 family protein n=1 Tax=Acinetobacter baumannii TaxID=470 RepID=UPI00387DC584
MSENENNTPPIDDKLNPTKPVGIQEGKKSILSGGRRLTKLPMLIAFVIGIVVVGLILITLVQAGKKETQQQDAMQDGGPGDSQGAPVDLFAGDKKNGAVDPLKEQQVGKPGENCLTAVLDNQGKPVMNPDGTPKQVPCADPTQVSDPAQGPQVVEGSVEDFENKRRLLELERIRQRNDLNFQREQQQYQEAAKEQEQRRQAMYDRQTALAGVLNTGSTINSNRSGGVSMPTGAAGGALSGLLPGGGRASVSESGGMSGELDPYDAANGQTKKQAWADQDRNKDVYLNKALVDKISDYEVKAGTVIPGILITGMNSDLPGQIIAQVSQNVYDTPTGRYLLIPQGTKLIGSYNSAVTYGQKRAMVAWERLIYPNGSSISINFAGVDQAGYTGLKDKVSNHYGRIFGQAALISMFSAAGQIATDNDNSENKSNGETLSEELGRQWSQTGQELIRKNMNIAPTIKIRPGYKLNVMVSKDMILKPYK